MQHADTSPDLVAHGSSIALTDAFERAHIIDKFLTSSLHGTLDASDLSPRSLFDVFDMYTKWAARTHNRETDPREKFAALVAQGAKEGDVVWCVPFAFYSILGDQVAAVGLLNEASAGSGPKAGSAWPTKMPRWIAARMPRAWVHAYESAKEAQVSPWLRRSRGEKGDGWGGRRGGSWTAKHGEGSG